MSKKWIRVTGGSSIAICLAALSLAFVGFTARGEDVYAKAFYWCRGMGVDANGNGRLDSGELYDSLNLHAPASSSVGANHPVFTNELVRMPYRGVLRQTQCLYLPQQVVITNEATQTGVLRPNAFALPAYVANALADKPHFAVAIRFRPDLTQAQKDYRWIFTCGHESMRGFMFGFTATGNHTMTFNANKYTITNQWANATFYCGGKSWQPNTDYCKINLGAWNDVVLSVDGRKVAILVSRDGYYDPRTATSVTNSTLAWFNTTYYTTTVPDGYDVSPKPNKTFMIGTEYYSSDRVAWSTDVTSNASKTFRGSIQSIAVWTNALTEAEMRAAAAWPRLDLWRVGVENDATTEFNGSGAAATTDVDADRWSAPAGLAAGGSVTFRFPLNTTGEAEMPEVFRIKPTSTSGAGTLRVTVNGTVLGSKIVSPGRATRWFVPETLLLAGMRPTSCRSRARMRAARRSTSTWHTSAAPCSTANATTRTTNSLLRDATRAGQRTSIRSSARTGSTAHARSSAPPVRRRLTPTRSSRLTCRTRFCRTTTGG